MTSRALMIWAKGFHHHPFQILPNGIGIKAPNTHGVLRIPRVKSELCLFTLPQHPPENSRPQGVVLGIPAPNLPNTPPLELEG